MKIAELLLVLLVGPIEIKVEPQLPTFIIPLSPGDCGVVEVDPYDYQVRGIISFNKGCSV